MNVKVVYDNDETLTSVGGVGPHTAKVIITGETEGYNPVNKTYTVSFTISKDPDPAKQTYSFDGVEFGVTGGEKRDDGTYKEGFNYTVEQTAGTALPSWMNVKVVYDNDETLTSVREAKNHTAVITITGETEGYNPVNKTYTISFIISKDPEVAESFKLQLSKADSGENEVVIEVSVADCNTKLIGVRTFLSFDENVLQFVGVEKNGNWLDVAGNLDSENSQSVVVLAERDPLSEVVVNEPVARVKFNIIDKTKDTEIAVTYAEGSAGNKNIKLDPDSIESIQISKTEEPELPGYNWSKITEGSFAIVGGGNKGEDGTYPYNSRAKYRVQLNSELVSESGVTVNYRYNGQDVEFVTEADTYTVDIVITITADNPNYKPEQKTYSVNFEIKDADGGSTGGDTPQTLPNYDWTQITEDDIEIVGGTKIEDGVYLFDADAKYRARLNSALVSESGVTVNYSYNGEEVEYVTSADMYEVEVTITITKENKKYAPEEMAYTKTFEIRDAVASSSNAAQAFRSLKLEGEAEFDKTKEIFEEEEFADSEIIDEEIVDEDDVESDDKEEIAEENNDAKQVNGEDKKEGENSIKKEEAVDEVGTEIKGEGVKEDETEPEIPMEETVEEQVSEEYNSEEIYFEEETEETKEAEEMAEESKGETSAEAFGETDKTAEE